VKKLLLLATSALVAPVIAVVAPISAMAQQITTSIQGQVENEAGEALPNAKVTITDTRTGASRDITADSQGLFSAQNLTTGGPYTVTATADGYQGQTVDTIFTSLQGATELTFSLKPVTEATEANTIVVTAARVRATQLEVGPGTSFNTQVLQSAPTFNRDVRDVIKMDPRVSLDREDVATGGSGSDRISCLGGNDRGNTFTVDGIPQSDVYGLNDTGFSSRSSTPIPYDAVRETQVQFAPFDVEYGQFTGCAINVVTRSGSNRFHGSAFYELSNDGMRGDELPGRTVAPIEPDRRWGVSLSGPIIKDRLFFFGAYEKQTAGQSQDEGPTGAGYANEVPGISLDQFNAISEVLSDVYGIETGPLVTSRPFVNKRLFTRLDWQITDNHRLEGTFQRLKENTVRSDDLFTGSSPQIVGLNTFLNSGTDSKYYSARLYSNWTDDLSTEIRYSHSKIQDIQDPVGGGEAQSGDPIYRIIVGVDNPPLGSSPTSQPIPDGAVLAGPGTSRSANDLRTKLDQFRAVANYDAGDHKLKLGFELNRADIFNLFVQNATGTLVFRNLADLQAGLLSPGLGNNQTDTRGFNVVPGNTEGAFINRTASGDILDAAAQFKRSIYSLYAQDDWRVNDDLLIVAGLRVDWFRGDRPRFNQNFFNRYEIRNDTGFSDIKAVILPRLATTWNVPEFSVFRRSRLTGGVGVFSGGDPVVWFGNVFQNNGQAFAQGTSQAAGCPAGQIDVVDAGGNFTGIPQCVLDAASATASAGQGFTQAIDPNIKMPTVLRANLGYQTDVQFADNTLGRGWHLSLDYIFSHYQNPFTIVDLSQVPDIRKGLGGHTIDGRPIYQTIDPLLCGAHLVAITPTPIYTGISAACFTTAREDELMLTNAGSYNSHVASAILSKEFDKGIFTPDGSSNFTLGYAYTNSSDRRNMFNSTAGSNYDNVAAFDRQDPGVSRGFFESRHNITFSGNFREKLWDDYTTSFGFTFVARSGRPYSLTFSGSGVFNDAASGSNNALLYIPTGISDPNISPLSNMTAVEQLHDFAAGLDCAKGYIGRTIKRNTCTNDWYKDLDLRFSQEIPGPLELLGNPAGLHDKLTAYFMFDNFLNLLKKSWNVQRRRQFSGLQEIASLNTSSGNVGVDAQGRYIISSFLGESKFENDNFINVSSSVWRVKVGLSYEF
jgi:hypothetical protein